MNPEELKHIAVLQAVDSDALARVAAALEEMVRKRSVAALVIVAPPRTLADLRHAFHADVKKRIVAEIGKDLTKHPVGEIETHLFRTG